MVGTTLAIIFTGLTHFDAAQAFTFPARRWEPTHAFFTGLGAALLIAVYHDWGDHNVCYLGGEISDPGRVIPTCDPALDCGSRAPLPDDESLDTRRHAVARGREVPVYCLGLHGADMGTEDGVRW